MTPRSMAEWGAVLPVWIGLSGVVASFVVWVLTKQVSPPLLGAFGTMIMAGQGADLVATLRNPPRKPDAEQSDEPEG